MRTIRIGDEKVNLEFKRLEGNTSTIVTMNKFGQKIETAFDIEELTVAFRFITEDTKEEKNGSTADRHSNEKAE